jgi:hypothetical protein
MLYPGILVNFREVQTVGEGIMRKRLSAILAVVACTASLSGCAFIHYTGPCFGVGCPAGTPGESSQYKMGEGPKAAPPQANAQSQPQPQPPAQQQSQPQTQTQPTPQTASAPAKNSNSPASLFGRLKAKF